jgi:hypothetical protein
VSKDEQIKEYERVLNWIIRRIEEEGDKKLFGKKPDWKQAAIESVDEAYGSLEMVRANLPSKPISSGSAG